MKTKKINVLLSALIVLLVAWAFSSCSKSDNAPAPPSKAALNAEITTAVNLKSTTTEGVGTGQYAIGSQATLQTAINAAQAVASNVSATKDQITAATAQLTAAVTAYQAAIVVPIAAADMVGQWTFDEITSAVVGTTVKDYSGNGHNGTLQAGHAYWSTTAGYPYATYPAPATNIPTIATDRYGNQHALHFLAGSNVQIPYSAALNPQTAITISLWAKADTLPNQASYKYYANNYMVALSRWNGYKFQFQDTPRAFFTVDHDGTNYDNQDNNATITSLTKWLHYAVTFTSGTMSFYINGQLTYSWTTASETGGLVLLNGVAGTNTAPVDLVFGQDLPTSAYSTNSSAPNYLNYGGYFIGSLDDVRIYKAALSATQILSIYNAEKP
ncbi:MAG TPA: LamG domain-containing protein [Cyclobacteriaceae bacterium]|jgi:hypothetical protein|nr:LamG domain-containing protein [Cyclobacteriaceae bacterium]